jgi:Uma2 family endonuclease
MNARVDFSHFAVPRYRVTVDDFYRMGSAGVFDGKPRVELIEGDIVTMAPIGTLHATTTQALANFLARELQGASVRAQQPIRLSEGSEPEPDIAIVSGRNHDYVDHHPAATDCLLLIEVAHTSQDYDRQVKAPLYAAYGVIEYWLVDTASHTVTVFRDPVDGRYRYGVEHPDTFTLQPLNAALPAINVADCVNG